MSDADKEVSSADQADINAFSKLNARFHDLEDDLQAKKEELVNLQDAQNEVLMQMDDSEPVKMSVGEVFINLSQDDATSTLNEKVENAETEVKRIESELVDIKGQMSTLKGRLTAKFGKNINLDEDD